MQNLQGTTFNRINPTQGPLITLPSVVKNYAPAGAASFALLDAKKPWEALYQFVTDQVETVYREPHSFPGPQWQVTVQSPIGMGPGYRAVTLAHKAGDTVEILDADNSGKMMVEQSSLWDGARTMLCQYNFLGEFPNYGFKGRLEAQLSAKDLARLLGLGDSQLRAAGVRPEDDKLAAFLVSAHGFINGFDKRDEATQHASLNLFAQGFFPHIFPLIDLAPMFGQRPVGIRVVDTDFSGVAHGVHTFALQGGVVAASVNDIRKAGLGLITIAVPCDQNGRRLPAEIRFNGTLAGHSPEENADKNINAFEAVLFEKRDPVYGVEALFQQSLGVKSHSGYRQTLVTLFQGVKDLLGA